LVHDTAGGYVILLKHDIRIPHYAKIYWKEARRLRDPRVLRWFSAEIIRRHRARRNGGLCDITLLSYPRSGNHLARFVIERGFRRPTLGDSDSEKRIFPRGLADRPLYLRGKNPIAVEDQAPLVVKRHSLWDINTRTRLIFLKRNPIDAILSNCRDLNDGEFEEQVDDQIRWWLRLDRAFRDWRPGARLLVSYENLTANPLVELERIGRFIGLASTLDSAAALMQEEDFSRATGFLDRPSMSVHDPGLYREQYPKRTRHLELALQEVADAQTDW
jgi:hypothetical protein